MSVLNVEAFIIYVVGENVFVMRWRGKMTEPTEEFLEMLAKSASHQLAIDRIEKLEEAVRELTNRIERLEGSGE